MMHRFIGEALAMALLAGPGSGARTWAQECPFYRIAQATKGEKTGKLQFKKIANVDGTTKDEGELIGIQVYLASDGQRVFVVSLYLMSHEAATKKFDHLLREAARVIEQTQVLRKDGEPLARRAVITLAAGADKDPFVDNMILSQPSRAKGLYFIQSASLEDALEFERQKITWDTNK